jgi:DNA adenine methylase
MILRRQGNKSKIAHEIQKRFPKHDIYIEPFFGAGGMFFNKPLAKYNIMNDIDSDVFNLYQVIQNRRNDFEDAFLNMPIHEDLLRYWKLNKETDPIRKALRFIFLSNFTYLADGNTMCYGTENAKYQLISYLNKTQKMIQSVQFANRDFREFFKQLRERNNKISFIYCDPPYLLTDNCYDSNFKENDVIDLLDILINMKVRFAYSEFDTPFILEQAKTRGLQVELIQARVNLKNRRTEILITNYKNDVKLF